MRNKIVLILVFSICLSLCISCAYKGEIPFERERWLKEDALTKGNCRPAMARNLISQNLLVGKTRNEILEMLGKLENMSEEMQNKISYTLEEKFWSIDPVSIEWLEITFNQEDKVEKAEIKFQKIG